MPGPRTSYADEIHGLKYRLPGESFGDAAFRVAGALADNDAHRERLEDIFGDPRFMAGGRVQVAMGSGRVVTPWNCFVSGTIADSFVDGEGNIMQRATEAARTMRMGGGIGYDFSPLRPKGALIRSLNSQSTGPIQFMSVYNGLGDCTASVGERRGAQMGILRIDHPDIEAFIDAKHDQSTLKRFNISVAVTAEFMAHLVTQKPFSLRFGGEHWRWVDPTELWEKLMWSTYDWAEPGVFFVDTVNAMNNLWYCERISATNPCGEQPLPPFGACLLGSLVLPKYLNKTGMRYTFDWDRLNDDLPHIIRAMDNVIDRGIFPLVEQGLEAKNKRRMGIGVIGLANCVEALIGRASYGSPEFLEWEDAIMEHLKIACYRASVELAKEKGPFPLFDADLYCAGNFIKSLPEPLIADIRRFGIRNSHLTSVAPTGTISLAADMCSGGVEPVFALRTERPVETPDGVRVDVLEDYGVRFLGLEGKTCDRVTPKEHVDVLCTAQKHVDSAVAKTCNVPEDISFEAFKNVYLMAFQGGAKGCTTFRNGGKKMALLVSKDKKADSEEPTSCQYDPDTGARSCA